MPKIKTHKGTAKRIKITRTGKLKRRRSFQGHNLEKKSAIRKQGFHKMRDVSSADQKNVRRLLNV